MLCKFKRASLVIPSSTTSSLRITNYFLQPSSSSCKLNNNNNYRSFSITNSTFSDANNNTTNPSSSASQLEHLNNSPSPSSSSNNNNSNNSSSTFTFSLEDLEKVKEELIQNLLSEQNQVPLPSPGKTSGNQSVDEATKQWRLTNTKDDENLQKLFKSTKEKQKATTSLLEQSQMNGTNLYENDDFEVGVDQEEFSKYVNPFNPETQEVNGPKGAEPTRFGDWERSGRCVDF